MPAAFFMTDPPVANRWANSLAAFFKSTPDFGVRTDAVRGDEQPLPNASRPRTEVMYLRLLRSIRLMTT